MEEEEDEKEGRGVLRTELHAHTKSLHVDVRTCVKFE